MPSGLKQIQVKYVPEEDRLLLAASTQDRREYRIWVTRRMTALVLEGLDRHLVTSAKSETAPAGTTSRDEERLATASASNAPNAEMQAFREDAALTKSDFSTPFNSDAKEYPLGRDGALAFRLQLGVTPEGRHRLALMPKEGQGIDLNLQESQLFGLRKLLVDGIAKAGWRLPVGRKPLTVPQGATIN